MTIAAPGIPAGRPRPFRAGAAWLLEAALLYAYVLVRPGGWRARVASAAPGLAPWFCLAELSDAGGRGPGLRTLLLQMAVAAPVLMSLAAAAALAAAGGATAPGVSLAFGLALGGTGTLTTAALLSVGGACGGIFIAAAFGLACGFAVTALGGTEALAGALGRMDVTARVAGGLPLAVPPEPLVGIAISIAIGIAGYTAAVPRSGAGPSFERQVGASVIGIATCLATHGGAMALAVGIARLTTRPEALNAAFAALVAVAATAASRVRGSPRRQALRIGALVGAIMAVSIHLATHPDLAPGATIVFAGPPTAILYSVLFVLAFVLAERLGGRWAGATASAVGSGTVYVAFLVIDTGLEWWIVPLSVLGNLIGLMVPWWLPVLLYPLEAAASLLLLQAEIRRAADRPALIERHPAHWDELQWLPLPGLDEHLLLLCERDPDRGEAALARISTTPQRWAARGARIELDARALERPSTVDGIAGVGAHLRTGTEGRAVGVLGRFLTISRNAAVAMQHGNLFDRRFHLLAVEDQLRDLIADLMRGDPSAGRFLPIAAAWREVVRSHQTSLGEMLERRQEIYNPYVRGMPLDEYQETFVGRGAESARIAEMLASRYPPPVLLYGQRRMGKTSLLNRLGRLLPTTIVPMFVDFQGASTKAAHAAGFLSIVSGAMCESALRTRGWRIEAPSAAALAADPFAVFDRWLARMERDLGTATALVAFDEFEALDAALRAGRFEADEILGLLRHIIQHRRRITVLLAGSHTLEEVRQWSTYLINVQTLHLGYLAEDEARRLIERPVRDFPLAYEPPATRRVIELTRCHPLFVQLLCHHIVARKNAGPIAHRRLATIDDVEAAVPDALLSGTLPLYDMAHQAGPDGAAVLWRLAEAGEGGVRSAADLAPAIAGGLDRALARLRRREIIEPAPGGYRFQIELVRRWFADHPPAWP